MSSDVLPTKSHDELTNVSVAAHFGPSFFNGKAGVVVVVVNRTLTSRATVGQTRHASRRIIYVSVTGVIG